MFIHKSVLQKCLQSASRSLLQSIHSQLNIANMSSSGSDSDSGPEDRTPAKKSKRDEKPSKDKKAKKRPAKDEEEEEVPDNRIDLGQKRFITVDEWKGRKRVDIREFYGEPGDLKPGKKGISLSAEQWKTFRKNMDKIDKLMAEDDE